jgi:hypothetical protein
MSNWITSHQFIYWLMTAAVVLAVVLPVWASGHRPMWPVSVLAVVVVGAAAAFIPRAPRLSTWLRRPR